MFDSVTILQTKGGLPLTKTFKADGTVEPYGNAKYLKPVSQPVESIRDLSEVLSAIEGQTDQCIIRGELASPAAGEDPDRKGYYARTKEVYEDKPHHWVMIDIDNFEPEGVDPVANPVDAITQYLKRVMPDFLGYSFHWQLSASAGQPSAKGKLKAHVWFWLSTAYDSFQLTAWAKSVSPLIDVAPLRTVQIHYTANPIYQKGLSDPVPVRSGFEEGFLDDVVPLQIDEVTLARALEYKGLSADYEFVDPADKAGPIGAFHRAYTVEEVLTELLEGEFEIVNERRVTWLAGGGATEGCFITDDRKHFGSTHNTDPFDNRVVNLFDLFRHYKFGHLDQGLDAFEVLDMGDKPSYQAAIQWCLNDERVQAQLQEETALARAERAHRVEVYRAQVQAAADAYVLEEDICRAIANDHALIDSERVLLTKIIQDKATELLGARPPIGDVRRWIEPAEVATGFEDVSEAGIPLCTIPNVRTLLHRVAAHVRYNVMTKEEELLIPGHNFSVDNKANASLAIIHSEAAAVQMATGLIKGHLLQIADENQYNPMMTWINSKPWDGVSRLDQLYATLKVDPAIEDLRNMLVRKWLLSAVYGAAHPEGVAAQGMLVLTGKQYKGKTRWFKRLVGDNSDMFREGVTLDPKDKDSVKLAVSAWITELGELDATFRKADIAALKAFITRQQDIFRKPFAAAESKFVRRTVFGGTVNDESYLRDPTGNRRFYTIPVLDVDHNHDVDMQQLWAEVYEDLYLMGEQHWLAQEWLERLNTHNEDHTEVDPITESVVTKLNFEADKKGWKWRTASEVCDLLGLSPDRGVATKVGKLLADRGCDRKKTNGVRVIFCPPEMLTEFMT